MLWPSLGCTRRPRRRPLVGWSGVLLVVTALISAGSLSAPDVQDADAAKRCKSSQERRTVTYSKPTQRRKRTVTRCATRAPKVGTVRAPGSAGVVGPVLRQSRRLAVLAAPARIARLQSGRAARRVLGADTVTDAAADAWFKRLGGGGGGGGSVRARAASSVGTGSDNGPTDGVPQGPAGTKTTMHRSGTEWGDSTPNAGAGVVSTGDGPEENPGFDKTITTETTSTRVQGLSSSMSKRTRIKVRMARCPDANGRGEGPVIYEETSTQTIDKPDGGRAVIIQTSTYTGTLKAQFGDDAHLLTAELTGDWSYATETRVSSGRGAAQRVSHSSVGGTAKDARLGPGGTSLTVSVTSASDDSAAIGGDPTGKVVSGIIPPSFAQEGLDRIVKNTLGGACVHVVADPTSLTLRSGQSATITAHPADRRGPFPGHLTTYVTGGSLTPSEADAAPEASFTFVAPAGKQAGEHDTIIFNHVSRRGKASGASVQVTYAPPVVSHTYRVMGAQLDETVTAQRPGSSFPGCPEFTGRQDNTMTLGPQPAPTGGFVSEGHLLDAPQGFIGLLGASGVATATTTMHGCELSTETPTACTNTGAGTISRDVRFEITLPKTGPAQLRWFFGFGPAAGLGSEGAGTTCLSPPLAWTTSDFALGNQTVPREVFEAATPQTLSFSVEFDLTDPNPAGAAQIHASDRYSMTIQRVRDDGTPL
jgi:hypothetical protein